MIVLNKIVENQALQETLRTAYSIFFTFFRLENRKSRRLFFYQRHQRRDSGSTLST